MNTITSSSIVIDPEDRPGGYGYRGYGYEGPGYKASPTNIPFISLFREPTSFLNPYQSSPIPKRIATSHLAQPEEKKQERGVRNEGDWIEPGSTGENAHGGRNLGDIHLL